MDGRKRSNLAQGTKVEIVEKHNQRTGITTSGKIKRILTNSNFHPHGIKVQLESGKVGRVKAIQSPST